MIIGISIAFALNSWAANARDKEARKQYIESLISDLNNEQAHLEENVSLFQQKIGSIQSIFPYLAGKVDGRDTIAQKIFDLAKIVYLQPNDVTYKTLINSGDLGLIPDFQLRKQLENHYSDQELIRLDYKRQDNIHERYFGDFMVYKMDFNKVRIGDYSFIDEPLLKNIIQSLYGTYRIAIESSRKGIERCEELKTVLAEKQ